MPLAILADGTLQSFGYSPYGFIYMADPELREIFEDYPNWFLDIDIENSFPNLKDCTGVDLMTLSEFTKRLKDVIDPQNEGFVKWEPEGKNLPNFAWLAKIYDYLSDKKNLPSPELCEVPIIPCNDGYLYCGGNIYTPLWCNRNISKHTIETLTYFNIPLIEANSVLKTAIEKFIRLHDQSLIVKLTVPDLIDTMSCIENLPPYNKNFYHELVSFFADHYWIKGDGQKDTDRQRKLSGFAIYPTTNDTPSNLHDAHIPASEPPKLAGSLKLLQLGSEGEWVHLFKLLGVPELNDARLIKYLINIYDDLDGKEQLEALTWIRDKFSQAQTELELESKKMLDVADHSNSLKKLVYESAIIRCSDGKLRAAKELYHPKNVELAREILGDDVFSPDMNYYDQNSKHWHDFFRELGMLSSPSADDIVNCVDKFIEAAQQRLTNEIEGSLMNIYYHLEANWKKLNKAYVKCEEVTLPVALRRRAWLPVRREENELKKIPGAVIPFARLYRADEVDFYVNKFLVASQRPLFDQPELPDQDFYEALGFRDIPDCKTVIDHFKELINLWTLSDTLEINTKSFKASVKNIYEYLSKHFVRADVKANDLAWLKNQLAGYKCLWDKNEFWLPEHTFQENVSYFGRYRAKICPATPIRDVYELLGQKRLPDLEDFIIFINDIADECGGNPLNEEQIFCLIEVLKEIDWLLEKLDENDRSTLRLEILVLTDDNLLLPPEYVLIPDAPLRLEALKKDRTKCKVLHAQVPHRLAIQVGCPSLLKDVCQKPIEKVGSDDVQANRLCQRWQSLLRSEVFQLALERLLLNDHDFINVDLSWLNQISIIAVKQIVTNLIFEGTVIASDVSCDHYFDTQECAISLMVDDEDVMAIRLVETLNNELSKEEYGGWSLNDTAKLVMILGSKDFSRIDERLTKLGVRAIKKSDIEKPNDITELVEDHIFDDDIGECSEDNENNLPEAQHGETTATKNQSRAIIDSLLLNKQESTVEEGHPQDGNDKESEQNNSFQIQKSITSSGINEHTVNTSDRSIYTDTFSQKNIEHYSSADIAFESIILDTPEDMVELAFGKSDKSFERNYEKKQVDQNSSETQLKSTGNCNHPRRKMSGKKSGQGTPRSKDSQTYRYGVRVRPELTEKLEPDSEEQIPQEIREKIENLGTQLVIKYEKAQGRIPKDMNRLCKNHPGYDIESTETDGSVRYIEIKSLRGDWGRRGVKVTRTQFEKGEDYANRYWLYVVERVEDQPRLFTIQNPVHLVGEFYYDDSWQQLAQISVVTIRD